MAFKPVDDIKEIEVKYDIKLKDYLEEITKARFTIYTINNNEVCYRTYYIDHEDWVCYIYINQKPDKFYINNLKLTDIIEEAFKIELETEYTNLEIPLESLM